MSIKKSSRLTDTTNTTSILPNAEKSKKKAKCRLQQAEVIYACFYQNGY